MSLDFLYLSEPDMLKAGVLDMKRCVRAIDDMFRTMGEGDYLMGSPSENHHGMMLWFPEAHRAGKMPVAGPDRRFMAMPAYLGGRFYVCGNKWYGSNMANKEKGLPRSILTVMLNDVDTGAPLALMSANLLSSMRTGAVPGVATKYLQKKGASVAAIIGAGVVSRSCLLGLTETIDVKDGEAKVYDLFFDKAQKFCEEMQSQTTLKLRPVETLEEAICGSDVISVAASGLAPVDIKDEWIKPGAVFLATGAANFSAEAYEKYNVVFDNWQMHKDWLDELREDPERLLGVNAGHPSALLLLMVARGEADGTKMMSLGDIIADPSKGRKSDDDVFLFLTGGMGTEDVAWGYDVYQEALKQGLGQKLSLWEKPHWA